MSGPERPWKSARSRRDRSVLLRVDLPDDLIERIKRLHGRKNPGPVSFEDLICELLQVGLAQIERVSR